MDAPAEEQRSVAAREPPLNSPQEGEEARRLTRIQLQPRWRFCFVFSKQRAGAAALFILVTPQKKVLHSMSNWF